MLDDFGDVFGIFFALTGPDFSDAQLYDTAKLLRRELLLVPDVKKIEIFGHQQEVIYIELARDRMAQLGIGPRRFLQPCASKTSWSRAEPWMSVRWRSQSIPPASGGSRRFRESAHPRGG